MRFVPTALAISILVYTFARLRAAKAKELKVNMVARWSMRLFVESVGREADFPDQDDEEDLAAFWNGYVECVMTWVSLGVVLGMLAMGGIWWTFRGAP